MIVRPNTGIDFWKKVIKTETCWLWSGKPSSTGYGVFCIQGKIKRAHRVAYELAYGPIPKGSGYHGMCVCHKCDNRMCVNPNHLFLGSHETNVSDMVHKKRHKWFEGENHGMAILTTADVLEIRKLYATGNFTQKELSLKYGRYQSLISAIILRKNWKHV